jgi:lipopolysaccharide transport system ATP-binding protein
MTEPVIKVENLSKQYRLGVRQGYKTFQEAIVKAAKAPLNRFKQVFGNSDNDDNPMPHALSALPSPNGDLIWALKDVSFEVKQGEVVGIIGRNGAGKSTLLKILSRITEPTKGRVELKGRVGSLLEVGTGFHPELTGHENIYLYGAILGMDRWEVTRKFDEIVAFSELEKFIGTPVKRYSSGMYTRLAFAVAAHLETEILLVDEVLAVGDVAFQKKCLGKMEDVGKEGRTVLFVSHNMWAISSLCNTGIILDSGAISYQGDIRKAVSLYNERNLGNQVSIDNCSRRAGAGEIRVKRVWVTNYKNEAIHSINPAECVFLNLEAVVSKEYHNKKNIVIGFGINTLEGRRLFTCVSSWVNKEIQTKGNYLLVRCKLPSLPLIPERYLIAVSIAHRRKTLDYLEHCEYFDIIQREDFSFSEGKNTDHGYLDIPYEFKVIDV